MDNDLIEAVILLPENLFYNTTAAGVIIVLNKNKATDRKGKILLLNSASCFEKGRPKNYLPVDAIEHLSTAFINGAPIDGELAVITRDQAESADYNLSPSRWVYDSRSAVASDLVEIIQAAR